MKAAILFSIVLFGVASVMTQTPMQWAAITVARATCVAKHRVDLDLVRQVRMGDFSSNDILLMRYCYCVYKSLTLMNNLGEINKETYMNVLPEQTDPTKFSDAVEACKNQTGSDRFEKAYKTLKCYNNKYPNDIVVL